MGRAGTQSGLGTRQELTGVRAAARLQHGSRHRLRRTAAQATRHWQTQGPCCMSRSGAQVQAHLCDVNGAHTDPLGCSSSSSQQSAAVSISKAHRTQQSSQSITPWQCAIRRKSWHATVQLVETPKNARMAAGVSDLAFKSVQDTSNTRLVAPP